MTRATYMWVSGATFTQSLRRISSVLITDDTSLLVEIELGVFTWSTFVKVPRWVIMLEQNRKTVV